MDEGLKLGMLLEFLHLGLQLLVFFEQRKVSLLNVDMKLRLFYLLSSDFRLEPFYCLLCLLQFASVFGFFGFVVCDG